MAPPKRLGLADVEVVQDRAGRRAHLQRVDEPLELVVTDQSLAEQSGALRRLTRDGREAADPADGGEA